MSCKSGLMFVYLSLILGPILGAATISVDPGQVINPTFLGVGAEYDPFNNMIEGTNHGFNGAYDEWEKLMVSRMGLKFARMHFQPDWFLNGWGVYDFENPRMAAVYKYLDTIQAAGTYVELNYGWKNSRDSHSWYCFPAPVSQDESAPNNPDAYAAAASELVHYLINVKGYSNVKYITSYNEPDGGDFDCPDSVPEAPYFLELMTKMHNELVADGRRNLVQIWGPEEAGSGSGGWVAYLANNGGDDFMDVYTAHCYPWQAVGEPGALVTYKGQFTHGKPVGITEYALTPLSYRKTYDYGKDVAAGVISTANAGGKVLAFWRLCDQYLSDPQESIGLHEWGFWTWLPTNMKPFPAYYVLSLMTRYIERNSQVLASASDDSEVKVGVFRNPAGEYTVVAVNFGAAAKTVTVNFSTNINKTLGRHLFTPSTPVTADALLIARDSTFAAGTSFTDSNLPANSVAVYTSLTPELQVKLTPQFSHIRAGQTCQLNCQIIDGSGGVSWSVIGGAANGTVDSAGLYTAPAGLPVDTVVAVKAQSATDPNSYGLGLVKIIPPGPFNVLTNPGMEIDSAPADNWPDGWWPRAEATRVTDIKNSGAASLRVAPSGGQYSFQNCDLMPGTAYTYRAWVKTQNVIGSGLALRYGQGSQNWQSPAINGTQDWTQISLNFTAPSDPLTGRADIFWMFSAGSGWFDDLSLAGPYDDSQAPTAPTNLQVTGASASTVTLAWSPASDDVGVAGYKIYRNGVQAGSSTTAGFTDTGLSPCTSYSYVVSAFDQGNNFSPQAGPVAATTLAAAQGPDLNGDGPVNLNDLAILIEHWLAGGCGVPGDIVMSGLVDLADCGALSAAWTGPDLAAPTVPAGLSVAAVTDSTVALSWNAASDNFQVAGYRIYRDGSLRQSVAGAGFTDTGLSVQTTYSYRVSAYDGVGNESALSNQVTATTAGGINLLLNANPGFETESPAGEVSGWQDRGAMQARATDQKKSGEAALKIANPGAANYTFTWGFKGSAIRTALTPGTNYRLSGWIKTENVNSSGARLTLTLATAISTQYVTGSQDWSFVQADFAGPALGPDPAGWRLDCVWQFSSGSAWFDDLSLLQN